MVNILITGEHSYIGNAFEQYVIDNPKFHVDKISVRNDAWKKLDFTKYDVILHIAGIAHIKESKENEALYYEVNKELTVALAQKSKKENVAQFIYLSSMSVYGVNQGVITKDTKLNPTSAYGESKKQAEDKLQKMIADEFKVCIVRPPMIYGKNCVGNYAKLSKLGRKTPIFAKYYNQRSMLYIENLCEFICLLMINKEQGIFMPQNKEYVCVSQLVEDIARYHRHKLILTKLFNWGINRCIHKVSVIHKVFGSLVYDKNLSVYKEEYCLVNLKESIRKSEV